MSFVPRLLAVAAVATMTGLLPAEDEPATEAPPRLRLGEAMVDQLQWRCVGPANMGGRIIDLAVNPADPSNYWVATGSGGLLKTVNNGVTFEHQFDHEEVVSLGAVAVAASDPSIVWVGTGEYSPRNSVSYGNGVYKSTDGGESWTHQGLDKIFQTGDIRIHPTNPDIVYVGALGRLYGPNPERGLYKTTDGGESWEHVLALDDKTGVMDVAMHPTDPDTLLVSAYDRERDGFDGNPPARRYGEAAGIYRTTDGGKTFERMTKGLPTGKIGRIGLDYYAKDPSIVYAIVESELTGKMPADMAWTGIRGEDAEAGVRVTDVAEDSPAATAGLKEGDIILAVDDEMVLSWSEFQRVQRSYKSGDEIVFKASRDRECLDLKLTFSAQPEDARSPFAGFLNSQRENLQDQQGEKGYEHGGVFRSADGGVSWTRLNSVNPRPMYFSRLRVDPSDENYIYLCGISMYRSSDRGETFSSDAGPGVHADQHDLWIDPEDGRHMVLGCDGGLYQSYDRCANWDHLSHLAIGQFYHVEMGPRRDYWVYGGLQDNGTWGAPNRAPSGSGLLNQHWINIGGGDGFLVQVDRHDPDQIYYESQNGGMGRTNLRTGERGGIRPPREGDTRARFNWRTPFHLSHHNSKIYYTAGDRVFRSLDMGRNLKAISPDITMSDRGSATAFAESSIDSDVLYVGTDDGALWMTRNGGESWLPLYTVEKEAEVEAEAEIAAPAEVPEAPTEASAAIRSASSDEATLVVSLPAVALPAVALPVVSRRAVSRTAVSRTAGDAGSSGAALGDPLGFPEDPLSGEWKCELHSEFIPEGEGGFRMTLKLSAEGKLSGSTSSSMGDSKVTGGKFNAEKRSFRIDTVSERGEASFEGRLDEAGKMSGSLVVMDGEFELDFTGVRVKGQASGGEANAEAVSGAAAEAGSGAVAASDEKAEEGGEKAGSDAAKVADAADSADSASSAEAEGQAAAVAKGRPLHELIPGPRWVSGIEASRHQAGRVYLSLDGHRSDDDGAYVFVSEDYGQNWTPLHQTLGRGSVRCIREDQENENLLYLGTEFRLMASLDRGQSWFELNSNLPTVAIHEIDQHEITGEIAVATHGRSIWISDVTALRQMNHDSLNAAAFLFEPNDVVRWRTGRRVGSTGARRFIGSSPQTRVQIFYSLADAAKELTLRVEDAGGKVLRELDVEGERGLHSVSWDLVSGGQEVTRRGHTFRRGGRRAGPGTYTVVLVADGVESRQNFRVLFDPNNPEAAVSAAGWEGEDEEVEEYQIDE